MVRLKGKPLSLGAKILAVIIVLGGLALKGLALIDIKVDDLIKVGGFVVIIFGTVDVSLIMEAIFGPGGLGARSQRSRRGDYPFGDQPGDPA